MAKEYNIGDRLYLPVWVTEKETNLMMGPDKSVQITDAKFSYAYWHGKTGEGKVRYGEDGLLLTATEIAENIAGRRCAECSPMYEELKARNAELEALLKEVMATRDEAIKQNDELITKNNELEDANCNLTKACSEWQIAAQTCADNAKVADKATEELRKENKELKAKVTENADTISRLSANKVALTEEVGRLRETIADRTIDVQHLTEENEKLKSDCNDWKDTADDRIIDIQTLTAERDNLKADLTTQKKVNEELKAKIAELTAWYEEANKTATVAAEANDDLKAKIADLRNRVGEQLAQIQDLNAEIHDLKEERDLKAKLAQEWHDNAHSTAKGLDELKGRYDELDSVNKEQAEKIRKLDAHNVYLKGLLSARKKMRIVLNNGNMYDVEVGDKVHPVYDMNNNLFFVKTEGGTVTSFLIGKEPGNIAGWYFV